MRPTVLILLLSAGLSAANSQFVYYDLPYGPDPLQTLDGYVALQSRSPIVVIVHGGGWVQGEKGSYSDAAQVFRNAGFAVANINYRLAPSVTFPGQPSDLACAIAYTKLHAKMLKGDSSRIALFGHSAGGHLVALHGVDAPQSRLQGCQSVAGLNVIKIVGCAGAYDFDLCSPYVLQQYVRPFVADSARYWKAAQPIEHTAVPARAEFLLITGDADTDVVWQQSRAFYDSLIAHGTTAEYLLIPGADHFSIFGTYSPTDPLFSAAIDFMKELPLPVQLVSFSASIVNTSGVKLEWSTLSEVNNYGFEVQKASGTEGEYQSIPGGFLQGYRTTLSPHHYVYIDSIVDMGEWWYRLKQIDLDGSSHYTEPVFVHLTMTDVTESTTPKGTALFQNYPNPFNPNSDIRYQVSEFSHVRLLVYDLLGREVAVLVNGMKEAGTYTVRFDGSGLSSGVYFYRLEAGDFVQVRKLMLLQ